MFESPFGEKFHFRTSLSLDVCTSRIDALGGGFVPFEFNFSDHPASVRRRNRFWLYENNIGTPPMLSARLVSNRGWTEIIGRGGSNRASFWSAMATLAFFVITGSYVLILEREPTGLGLLIGSVPAAVYMYWRNWKDPDAGRLIDYLQDLLGAEPMPKRYVPPKRSA